MGCFSAPKASTISSLAPAQQQLLNTAIGQHLIPGLSSPVDVYGGQRVAGASPLQSMAYNWGSQLPGQTQALQGLGTSLVGQVAQPFDVNAALSPVTNAASLFWSRDVVPSVMERFAGMGAADSGGAMNALARSGQEYGTSLAGQLAPLALNAALQGRGQQLQAGSLLPSIAGMSASPLSMLAGLGSTQFGQSQAQLDAAMQAWLEGQGYSNPWLQMAGGFLGGTMSPIQQAGGLGYSMLAGAAGGLGESLGSGASSMLGKLPVIGGFFG